MSTRKEEEPSKRRETPPRKRIRPLPITAIKEPLPEIAGTAMAEAGTNAGCREALFARSKMGKTYLVLERLSLAYFMASMSTGPGGAKTTSYKLRKSRLRGKFFHLYCPTLGGNEAYKKFGHVMQLFSAPYGVTRDTLDREESLRLIAQVKNPTRDIVHRYIIIDDMAGHTFLKQGSADANILGFLGPTGKHYPVTLILLYQRFVNCNVDLRDGLDIVTFFQTDRSDEMENFRKAYFGRVTKDEFAAFWASVFTNPYDHLTMVRENGGEVQLYRNDEFKEPLPRPRGLELFPDSKGP
jgi:hypothetical protein